MATEDSNSAFIQPPLIAADSAFLAGSTRARPFIKWAGGKTQLLIELTKRLPRSFKRYLEPFVGGGALFFHLSPERAYLSDTNQDLVDCYRSVRDDVDGLIHELSQHRYEEQHYYSVREWDRREDYPQLPAVVRAARFIYLNKSCFNGLYRVNSKGHFNVPFGDYANPTIVDPANLRACSRALSKVDLAVADYAEVLDQVEKGDFVYLDPPYAPLSVTSSFTAYTKKGFDFSDQEALRELCHRLDKKGAMFMLSNSATSAMQELYKDFSTHIVTASRAINSKASQRGPVLEVIVTNYTD